MKAVSGRTVTLENIFISNNLLRTSRMRLQESEMEEVNLVLVLLCGLSITNLTFSVMFVDVSRFKSDCKYSIKRVLEDIQLRC